MDWERKVGFLQGNFGYSCASKISGVNRIVALAHGVCRYLDLYSPRMDPINIQYGSGSSVILSYDRGEGSIQESHLLRKPPVDHTLRHPCKFLILGKFYRAKKIQKM